MYAPVHGYPLQYVTNPQLHYQGHFLLPLLLPENKSILRVLLKQNKSPTRPILKFYANFS